MYLIAEATIVYHPCNLYLIVYIVSTRMLLSCEMSTFERQTWFAEAHTHGDLQRYLRREQQCPLRMRGTHGKASGSPLPLEMNTLEVCYGVKG